MPRISDHKNVNKSKNYCSLVKLESKNNDKKIINPGRDQVGKLPSTVEEEWWKIERLSLGIGVWV